ncbi:molybdate ABC transporter permease subunit [Agaribacter flavus]|uniref:Molybdenum transport system permease n=1 Tax=Agaribacter flavus TaxID=1902781 RepID=A0ABV7FS12_9ALTE
MRMNDYSALGLTFTLASFTVIILLLMGLPLAWSLSRYKGKFKPLIEATIALPLVLPPTVLGFYLLLAFSPDTFIGALWLSVTGEQFVFSFAGILVGSIIYSMPFVFQPLVAAFEQHAETTIQRASTLGISRSKAVTLLLLPQIKPAIVTAITLGFAHTLGEFGLILMIGGNIPGETQVVSIALFNHVETLNYTSAHNLAMVLLGLSFIMLALLYRFNRNQPKLFVRRQNKDKDSSTDKGYH